MVDRRIVVSEKAAAAAVLAQRVQVGDILEGCVSYVSDFGAFVMLNDPAGTVSGAEVRFSMCISDTMIFPMLCVHYCSACMCCLLIKAKHAPTHTLTHVCCWL